MTKEQKKLSKSLQDFMYQNSYKFQDIRSGVLELGVSCSTACRICKGKTVKPKSMAIVADKLGVSYCEKTLKESNVFTLN